MMEKISIEKLSLLLKDAEQTHFDFKLEHHENTSRLVHDILCLSNAEVDSDRFIIYGVNNQRELKGFSGKRKKQAEIVDCLNNSNFNTIPEFLLYSIEIDGIELDILHIKNNPNKPYYLLKDKSDRGVIVKAGYIYSRINDSNTPIDKFASELQISKMWQERFGLDKNPMERAYKYLKDISGWKIPREGEAYYEQFPDYKLKWESEPLSKSFHEHWIGKFSNCELANLRINLFFRETLLKTFYGINVEHRQFFPVPKYYNLEKVRENGKAYVIKNHIDSYICAIVSGTKNLNYYDKSFIEEYNITEPIDVYFSSMKTDFAIYGLDIELEKECLNQKESSYAEAINRTGES